MAITTWAATTGDWDDSKFSRGWDGPNIAPAKGDLTGLSLGTTWDSDTSTWATVSGNWDTGTLTPLVGHTYIFTIDSAGNLVLTPYDPDWPLVRDPTFIAPILIS